MSDLRQTAGAGDGGASRILWSVVSAALLAWLIASQMGWKWAVAGVFGILVHELGHALVINAMKLGPARIDFVPFLGAVTRAGKPAPTELKGALIAVAGPLFGLLAVIPFFVAAQVTGDAGWAGGAFFICLINLVNLLPAPPLDGSKVVGPALAAVHPLLEKAAILAVGAGAAWWAISTGRWLFGGLVALGVASSLMSRRLRPQAERLTLEGFLWSFSLYLMTACFLIGTMLAASSAMGMGSDALGVLTRALS
jgi:Zn-dependent protease